MKSSVNVIVSYGLTYIQCKIKKKLSITGKTCRIVGYMAEAAQNETYCIWRTWLHGPSSYFPDVTSAATNKTLKETFDPLWSKRHRKQNKCRIPQAVSL